MQWMDRSTKCWTLTVVPLFYWLSMLVSFNHDWVIFVQVWLTTNLPSSACFRWHFHSWHVIIFVVLVAMGNNSSNLWANNRHAKNGKLLLPVCSWYKCKQANGGYLFFCGDFSQFKHLPTCKCCTKASSPNIILQGHRHCMFCHVEGYKCSLLQSIQNDNRFRYQWNNPRRLVWTYVSKSFQQYE